jgi:hypothetical protein
LLSLNTASPYLRLIAAAALLQHEHACNLESAMLRRHCSAVLHLLTCVSLHQPFSSMGRSGLSTSRATSTSSSRGRPSRLR